MRQLSVWQKNPGFLDKEWFCIATESWNPAKTPQSCFSLPLGLRRTPLPPHLLHLEHVNPKVCQVFCQVGIQHHVILVVGVDIYAGKEKKEKTYNGLWSQIHSWMKKVLRTGSFDKLSRGGFCLFSAEKHDTQNIENPPKHVTRQICHWSGYRSTLMPGVRKVGYCAIYSPLRIWTHDSLINTPTQKIRWQPG